MINILFCGHRKISVGNEIKKENNNELFREKITVLSRLRLRGLLFFRYF